MYSAEVAVNIQVHTFFMDMFLFFLTKHPKAELSKYIMRVITLQGIGKFLKEMMFYT